MPMMMFANSSFVAFTSKLVIVVEETKASGENYEGLECPCAVLELNKEPGDLLIVSTTGKQFDRISI